MGLLFLVLVLALAAAGSFLLFILRSVLLAGMAFVAATLVLVWVLFFL